MVAVGLRLFQRKTFGILDFINMDASGGYDQISHLVSARVRKFLSYLN